MATVTPAGRAGDAALVVKGDGRVHGRTPLADWCDVHGVSMTTGKLDAICKVRTHDGSFLPTIPTRQLFERQQTSEI